MSKPGFGATAKQANTGFAHILNRRNGLKEHDDWVAQKEFVSNASRLVRFPDSLLTSHSGALGQRLAASCRVSLALLRGSAPTWTLGRVGTLPAPNDQRNGHHCHARASIALTVLACQIPFCLVGMGFRLKLPAISRSDNPPARYCLIMRIAACLAPFFTSW